MYVLKQTRVSARALTRAATIGGALAIGLVAAFLAGDMASATVTHLRVARLNPAAAQGFSEAALRQNTQRMDAGALAIAQRHDPFTVSGDPERDHQAAQFAARLERREGALVPIRLSVGPLTNPAARPFRMSAAGALDGARDLECLTQAVYYEARGETAEGQQAVAQVVLNRVRHPAFPKSVCGVVFQGAQAGHTCQFSFACDGSLYRTRDMVAWRRAQTIAARALDGYVMPAVGNATNFHASRLSPVWGGTMVRVAQVGLHVFYRFGGSGGAPSAFRADPERLSAPPADTGAVYASLASVIGLSPVTPPPAPETKSAEAKPALAAPAAVEPAAAKPVTLASAS